MKTKQSFIKNERGGMVALLSVIVLSMIVVTALTSVYSYLTNRAKVQAFLKMNYQFGFVMEDMGRAVAQAYQLAQQEVTSPGVCSGPLTTSRVRWLDCVQVCAQDTHALPGNVPAGTDRYAVCVKNDYLNKLKNGADYFCTNNPASEGAGITQPGYCPTIASVPPPGAQNQVNPQEMFADHSNKTKLDRWYARLDRFYDRTIIRNAPAAMTYEVKPPAMISWLLPTKAYADTGGGNTPPITTCNAHPDTAGCDAYCSGSNPASFCSDPHMAQVQIGNINCDGSNMNGNVNCKACSATERNRNAGAGARCMDLVICPPWVTSAYCDRTHVTPTGPSYSRMQAAIHQVVRF